MSAKTLILLLTISPLSAVAVDILQIPRLPAIVGADREIVSQPEVRGLLHRYLRTSNVILTETRAQEGEAFEEAGGAGEPRTVAAAAGVHPVLDLVDSRYRLLPYDYIAVLVDWFEALALSMNYTPSETRRAGFRTNKVARLMRIFISQHLREGGEKSIGAAPAIGWCRVLLQEDWGRCRKGETHTFIVVGTERGWFAVDPYARMLRRIDAENPSWILEFLIM